MYERELEGVLVKVVLLGDAAVGKTSLRRRWMGEKFKGHYLMTIGADFSVKTIKVNFGGEPVFFKFQVWDLAGQVRFQVVREGYYKGAHGAILIYDITNMESYQNTPNWIYEFWKNNGRGVTPFILVANKIDLRNQIPHTIRPEYGNNYAAQLSEVTRPYGFEVPYLETSAKTGENVDQAFQLLGETITKYSETLDKRQYNARMIP